MIIVNRILRQIPSIEQLAIMVRTSSGTDNISHDVAISLLRAVVADFRKTVEKNLITPIPTTEAEVQRRILNQFATRKKALLEYSLKKTINATGVVLHTNLGRAPLSERAKAQVAAVMEGYSTLEYDLESGRRGDRYGHVEKRLTQLTGSEAALVVNNNAAAVLLVLAGIARGKEVIVSRGELVEIGGSFRIPDVIRQSGATLIEVGTTNKTHIEDYSSAITPTTAAILKVHTSNFAMVGFTSHPNMKDLCRLANQHNLVSINDVGSGTLLPINIHGTSEPTVQDCLDAGFDLVTFSGDKLLGAGQAGLIAGKKKYVELLKKEPLLRALRIDKLSLAALEGTLIDYSSGKGDVLIPSRNMLHLSAELLLKRAEKLAESLTSLTEQGWKVRVIKTHSLAGGGSLPGVEISGYGVEIVPCKKSVSFVAEKLRICETPVICLVRIEALIFDVRCLLPGDETMLCEALSKIANNNEEIT